MCPPANPYDLKYIVKWTFYIKIFTEWKDNINIRLLLLHYEACDMVFFFMLMDKSS